MKLSNKQIELLKQLMGNSAQKGNLANSGLLIESGEIIASAESLVASNHDATAHSERMLVSRAGKLKGSNYTPGLQIVTVVEPCIMCMSAASQAGIKEIYYIVPAAKYVDKIPWTTDSTKTDKNKLAADFSEPIRLIHLKEYEEEFSKIFEEEMGKLLKIDL